MAKPIQGTKDDDLSLTGTSGNDTIQGRDGNDTITGGGGNDKIDGGKGIDTAVYSGNFADYTISSKHDGHDNGHGNDGRVHGVDDNGGQEFTVADNRAGHPDGTDSLKNVEFLKFADGIFDVNNDVTHRSDASLSGIEVQNSGAPAEPNPGEPWWSGGGNSVLHYNMADLNDQNIELGLKFQIRHGADITPGPVDADGTVHYTAPSGFESTSTDTSPPHTAVNFDYVVNTGLNGSTSTLADFDFKMIIAQTQGAVTQTVTFDLDPATHFWVAEGSTPAGFGADDFHSGTAPSATTVSQVAENSENFKFIQNAFGETTAQMSATNTKYDITLEALDHAHNILGSAHSVLLLV